MSTMAWELELNTARTLLLEAGRISLNYSRDGFLTEIKEDDSPVTEADKATETFLVESLSEAFPQDGFLGEEGSSRDGSSGRRWILDPIDGTKDYSRGIHSYSNLLALEADGEVVVGLANHPVLGNLYSAAKGHGAWLHAGDGSVSQLHASTTNRFGRALLGLNGINHLANKPFAPSILDFLRQFWAIRCFGGLEPVYVVAGQMDAFLSVTGKPWDYAPSKILVEEAGGCYFDFEGKATIYSETCIVCNKELELPIRRYFEQAIG